MKDGKLQALARYWPKTRGVLAYGLGPILGLASGPLLARAMGPDGRGQFAAIMQPLTLAGAIASIGIPAAATYFVARGNYSSRSILLRGLIISIAFSCLAYGALLIYAGALSDSQGIDKRFLAVIWCLVFISAFVQIRRGYLQGLARWKRLDLERFTFALLRFFVVAGLAVFGVAAAESYAIGSLGAFLIAAVIVMWPIHSRNKLQGGSLPNVPYRTITTYSLSAALGTIAVVANNRLDQVLLPLMAPSMEVGYYAIAVTVAEVPIILGTLASRDALYQASKGAGTAEILKSSGFYLLMATVLGLTLALLAPYYMAPVFGIAFEGAILSVQILALGTVLGCLALTLTAIVTGSGRPALASFVPLLGLTTTGILFFCYGPQISSGEAALIAAISQGVSVIAGLVLVSTMPKKVKKVSVDEKQTSVA